MTFARGAVVGLLLSIPLAANTPGTPAQRQTRPVRRRVPVRPQGNPWRPCCYTEYVMPARHMANGEPYRADRFTVASKDVPLGSVVELRYAHTGHAIAVVTDTGRLPLETRRVKQLDVTPDVSRSLGLYNERDGRAGRYRVLRKGRR